MMSPFNLQWNTSVDKLKCHQYNQRHRPACFIFRDDQVPLKNITLKYGATETCGKNSFNE